MSSSSREPDDRVRLDKWLWAARFFKTRALATEAVDGGKVHVKGERVKPAKLVKIGDQVQLRMGPYEYHVVIRGLADRRGPAAVATALYEELESSIQAREKLAEQLRLAHSAVQNESGRPTKRDRRQIENLRRRSH